MEVTQFKQLVARLEHDAARAPGAYRGRVAALAALGFAILALLLGAMGLGLLVVGGVAVAIVVSGGKALILLLKLGKLLILLALPMFYLLRAAVKALFIRLPAPQGREIGRAEAPALFAALERMRAQWKGPQFHHVLVVDDVNAAVVQRPAFGLFGWPRNYLLLGLPLLEAMPADEALSVVAHEYGHLAGAHGRFSAWIYRLRHTWGTVQAHLDQVEGFLGKLVAPLIRWYAPYFNAYTFVLARADEYQADAAAAELVGVLPASQALKRVNIVAPRHERFMDKTYERIDGEPMPPADLMQRWADEARAPLASADADTWLREALDREGHFADSHPTLRARLQGLLTLKSTPPAAFALDQPPPPLAGPSAAQEWLGALAPALRAEFEQAWAARVAAAWAERHGERRQLHARLAELRGLAERDRDQQLEMLRLVLQLEPDTDVRDDLAAFNAAHPGHATGLYSEGRARLDRDDDAGLALLEQVMGMDPDAIKPCCEHAHAFLRRRKQGDDLERAEAYAERWRQRDAFETARDAQIQRLDPAHALAPHDLDEATLAAVKALLVGPAVEHVAELWLARRVIPADPDVRVWVMGVKLTWWGRQRSRQSKVVNRLAALALPISLTVFTLEGDYAKMAPKFKAIAGARLLPA